jgi:aminobenzoyl-glutamate utilization protein B
MVMARGDAMKTLLLLLAAASIKQAVIGEVDQIRPRMVAVNQAIWSYAEPGLEEVRSSQELMNWLKENGFSIQSGVAGMPTAFVASYGTSKPVVAFLAEYDALMGLSQKAVPHREARDDPSIVAGHGCGHSVFGTGTTAAAIAVKKLLEREGLSGTVRLYGTPAEETVDAKTFMLRDGLFDDVDAVLAWHVADKTRASYGYSKAVVTARFSFEGLPAHASTSPEKGRSALDAVELMNVGVNYLREHVPEDTRIHYVVTDGGGQPNVVPPHARSWYYVRADRHDTVERVFARVLDVARGAALMTGTEMSYVVEGDAHEVLPNRALAIRIHENLELVGAPKFTEEEKQFALKTQEALDPKPERALSEDIEPLTEEPEQHASSTDQGDLSWHVPSGGLNVAAYTLGAPGHSWQIVACTGMSIGERAMVVAAKALAATAVDLMTEDTLLEQVRQSFHEVRDPLTFTTLLPEDAHAPTSLPKR